MNRASVVLCLLVGIFNCPIQVKGFDGYVTLTNDGPCVEGGRIIFRADLYEEDGTRPSGTYTYWWRDNALYPHKYESPPTTNTTSYWTVDYPTDSYPVGIYGMQVVVTREIFFVPVTLTSRRMDFQITPLLNGNMSIAQGNKSLSTEYVASGLDTRIDVKLREGDDFYVKNNSSDASTYWFVDCKYYGMTEDFSFNYKFKKPDVTHTIEALVILSHELPVTTTVAPATTTPATTTTPLTTSKPSNLTISINSTIPIVVPYAKLSSETLSTNGSTIAPTISTGNATTIVAPNSTDSRKIIDGNGETFGNVTFPFVCLNSSVIPPDPKKTYGYFHRRVEARAPISNITVDGTNWIQPWDMLSLKVACHGSGPFVQCLKFHRGEYNVTGHERCDEGVNLSTCNFSIVHYFLEPSVYTILVILDNEVSKQIYPLTINIYKVSTKPQLSVIVVPVSCSLAAVVLIIFGVAYYIQSRARYTVEVADFDFGQNNPEMEYKTFTERLRDSFNNTGYKQLSNPGSSTGGGGQWEGIRQHERRMDS